jgi:hypothetical protein
MNRDIIRMAREAGLHLATDVNWMPIIGIEYLARFAALVAAAAKEEMLMAGNDQWLEEARKAERDRACHIVTGLCISDNNAREINEAIRGTS